MPVSLRAKCAPTLYKNTIFLTFELVFINTIEKYSLIILFFCAVKKISFLLKPQNLYHFSPFLKIILWPKLFLPVHNNHQVYSTTKVYYTVKVKYSYKLFLKKSS